MLTKVTQKCLALSVQMMYISGSGPIRWNKEEKRVKYVDSILFTAFSVLNFAVMVLFEAFLAYRTFQVLVPPDDSTLNLPLACHMLYTLSCYSIPVHLQWNTFARWGEIPAFVNSYIDFYNEFKAKFVTKNKKDQKNGCETLCRVFITLAGLITLQNAVLIIRKPDQPFFLTSLLANPKNVSIIKRLPIMLVHFNIWISFWGQLLFYGHILYTYTFPGLFLIKQMRNSKTITKLEETRNKLRKTQCFLIMYRCLQVQHDLFEFCLRDIFFPGHKMTMGAAVVFSIYGAVKLDGGRAVLMGFVASTGLAYLTILFRRLGKLYEQSIELRNSWKGENKLVDRFIRSSPPLRVNIGNYYFVSKSTVVVLTGIIFNTTINMLVTF